MRRAAILAYPLFLSVYCLAAVGASFFSDESLISPITLFFCYLVSIVILSCSEFGLRRPSSRTVSSVIFGSYWLILLAGMYAVGQHSTAVRDLLKIHNAFVVFAVCFWPIFPVAIGSLRSWFVTCHIRADSESSPIGVAVRRRRFAVLSYAIAALPWALVLIATSFYGGIPRLLLFKSMAQLYLGASYPNHNETALVTASRGVDLLSDSRTESDRKILADLIMLQGGASEFMKRFVEASDFYRKAAEIRADILGPGHPETIRALMYYGETCIDVGAYDEAERSLRSTQDIIRQNLGESSEEYWKILWDCSWLYSQQRDHRREEEALRLLCTGSVTNAPVQLGRKIEAHAELARTMAENGRIEEARTIAEECQQDLGSIRNSPPYYVYCLTNIGRVFDMAGSSDEALQIYEKAFEEIGSVEAPSKVQIINLKMDYAEALSNLGRESEAYTIADSVLDMALKEYGANHPRYADALAQMASFHIKQKDYSAAEPMLRYAIDIYDHNGLHNCSDRTAVIRELANIYAHTGKKPEADKLLEELP